MAAANALTMWPGEGATSGPGMFSDQFGARILHAEATLEVFSSSKRFVWAELWVEKKQAA